jgi:hypothetical protein
VSNIDHLGSFGANTYIVDALNSQFCTIGPNIGQHPIRVSTRTSLVGVTTQSTITGTPVFSQTYQSYMTGPHQPLTKYGAPNDGDFQSAVNGLVAYDKLLSRSYVRIGASWKQVTTTTPAFTDITGTVATCTGWWDFSDATYMFTDTGFTTPVSSDGNSINSMADKSGAGNNLTVSGTAPVYKVNIQNGHSVGRWVGGSGYLVNLSVAARAAATYFIVFEKRTAEAGTSGVISFVDSASNACLVTGQGGGNVTNYNQTEASGAQSVVDTPNAWHVLVVKITDAATAGAYVDGAATTTWNPKDIVTTGTGFEIGNATGFAGATDFDFAEVLIYSSALSDADRNTVEAALKAKWGTP